MTRVTSAGQVVFDGPATHVSAGGCHSAVVVKGGRINAFGDNSYGQLGVGSMCGTAWVPTPVDVPTACSSVDCGGTHTLALTGNRRLRCSVVAQHTPTYHTRAPLD